MIHVYFNYLSCMVSDLSIVRYLISVSLSVVTALVIVLVRNHSFRRHDRVSPQ
jgi:hypothetical protein